MTVGVMFYQDIIFELLQPVVLTVTVSLVFIGCYMMKNHLSSGDITKMIIAMITLNIICLLRLEMTMAVGFGAVVIAFLSTDGLEILTDMRRHGNRCY